MIPPVFARGTKVSVEKSRAEIDTLLGKHGATQRGIVTDDEGSKAVVAFVLKGAHYRVELPMPKPKAFRRPEDHEQATRERWRAVVLMLKSKLEIVRLGVSTVEREFLADLVLPNGRTAYHEMGEYLAKALAMGKSAPPMLPPGAP